MGNQGKVCVEVQNDEKYSCYAILDFSFSKTEDICSKVRQNKVGENGYCKNSLLNKVSSIP